MAVYHGSLRPRLRPITIGITITIAAILFGTGCEPKHVAGPVFVTDSVYELVPNWPAAATSALLGEVSGVDVDAHGHVFVFHRATRGWDVVTRTPIAEATVLMLDSASGAVLRAWGANQFRLPHGLTVDSANNVWLTDAALHQVFQFSHDGDLRRTRGVANEAGRDTARFNRPTDVAVRTDGGFYVSDGYENQRVVHFRSDGKYLFEWGRQGSGPTEFALPHMIDRRAAHLFVADRENERVSQFDTAGASVRTMRPQPGFLVYSVTTTASGKIFIGLRNAALSVGFVVRTSEGGLPEQTLGLTENLQVHDVATDERTSVYVAETQPRGLRKYRLTPTAR